ncbi:MAG: cupin domain-containing protein [Phycisphaerales bacterium]
MTKHSQNDASELAEAYLLGELDERGRVEFEQRLSSGDPKTVEAWDGLRPIAERLAVNAPAMDPGPSARAKFIDRLRPDALAAPSFAFVDESDDSIARDAGQMVIMRQEEIDWRDGIIPGVQSRNLFVDRKNNKLTLLIRMAPGTTFPDHAHPSTEECLVLEGDLRIAGTTLHRMDYLRTPAGGNHGAPYTKDGCLLLVTVSLEAA